VTVGEAALSGVNGVGRRGSVRASMGRRVRRWGTTLRLRPGGDQRRRRCAEVAAAVQRQRQSLRVTASRRGVPCARTREQGGQQAAGWARSRAFAGQASVRSRAAGSGERWRGPARRAECRVRERARAGRRRCARPGQARWRRAACAGAGQAWWRAGASRAGRRAGREGSALGARGRGREKEGGKKEEKKRKIEKEKEREKR